MGGVPQSPGLKPLGRPTSGAALPLLSTLWLADLCIGTAAPGLKPAAGGCGAAAGCAAAVALLGASGVVHWAAGPVGTEAEGVLVFLPGFKEIQALRRSCCGGTHLE